MKKLYLLVFTLLYCLLMNAQDTLVKYNGEHILSRIIEITPTEIHYKKINFLEGPTYVEKKIAVRLIKYSTGLIQEFGTEPTFIKRQNDTIKITDKIIIDDQVDYYGQPERGQLKIGRKTFMRDGEEITEEEFYNWLKYTKDGTILALAAKSMRAKKRQKISLVCITAGIGLVFIPPLFVIAEPIFIYIYFNNGIIRRTSNKKAVKCYNEG